MPIAGHRWGLTRPGISVERDADSGRVLSIAHAASPVFADWAPGEDEASLKALMGIAGQYFGMVAGLFGLPATVDSDTGLFRFDEDDRRLKLTWLPIGSYKSLDPSRHFPDPRYSFWIRRKTRDAVYRSAVFLAVPSLFANDEKSAIGSGLGVRVDARVIEPESGDWRVGITGASCSAGLAEALGPGGPDISADLAAFFANDSDAGFKHIAKAKLRAVFGLADDAAVLLEGFRMLGGTGDEAAIDLYASLPRSSDKPGAIAYALTVRAVVRDTGDLEFQSLRRFPLTAHQQLQENLFEQDPTSLPGAHTIVQARANRSPEELAAFTFPCTLPGLPAGPSPISLQDTDYNQVEVRESELLGGDPDAIKTVDVPIADPRTPRIDDFSALSGYMNARLLFDRMRSYGLSPDEYFKFAKFPLIVRYRTTISPGPGKDGRTVNAAVDYDPPSAEFGQGKDETQDLRKPLQVRFALGDLRRSASRREPLGIAVDPRWAWHEFGHVLLAAATGGLELPFAHSVGDALAAIACDPMSRLATHVEGRLRGATFPWAHITRRHDRAVLRGWGWSGTYHRPGRLPEYKSNRLRKGYHSEQVLSSSLFRLYRSLGGDTLLEPAIDPDRNPDTAARLRAADYVIYLIMQAMESFPPASAGSVESAEQFVLALDRTDCGTLPETDPALPLYNRVGGWARKVIRWAFEAQGLYSAFDEDIVNDTPGEPPEVDVFIDNRRPPSEGRYLRGGYMPVSLDWHDLDGALGEPSWLATPAAMDITNDKKLRVTVHNRGATKAEKVRVRAWYAEWNQPQPPAWDPVAWNGVSPTWTELKDSPSPSHDIERGSPHRFPDFKKLPSKSGRYLVLAAALCAQDEPNMNADEYPELPTAKYSTPIVDLVCGDNNLGLIVYDVP